MLTTEDVFESAKTLNADDQAKLVARLMDHLAVSDAESDVQWIQESKERLTGYHSGDIKTLSAQEVLSKHR